MKKTKELNFEEGLGRLEELVASLETRALTLDQALSSFEEGLELCRKLSKKLKEAEGKVELLTKDRNGLPQSREFNLPDEGVAGEEDDD